MKFSELKELLYKKLHIDHLADIARELNVSPQAVSNWKARDRVPYKYVKKVNEKIEILSNKNLLSKENIYIDDDGFIDKHNEKTLSPIDLLNFIINHLKLLVITPFVFSVLMIFNVQFIIKPTYISTAKIMSSTASMSSPSSDIAAQFGIYTGAPKADPQWVYTEIIKSRTIARSMLKRKFDTIQFGKNKTLLDILMNDNKLKNNSNSIREKIGVDKLIGMIAIDKKISHYELAISAHEPLLARDLAIALIDELEFAQRKYNKSKTSKTRIFIEGRIVEIEKELNNAEEALKDFRDRNRRMENSPALLLEQQRLSREVSVLIGVFTTLKQQLENIKIEEVKESNYVIVLDPPEAPLSRSKPNKRFMVILAGLFGLIFGSIFGLFKDYSSDNKEIKNGINELRKAFFKNLKTLFAFNKR